MQQTLADVLVGQGIIDQATLAEATAWQSEHGTSLGKALVDMGRVTEQQIVAAVAAQIGIPFVDAGPGTVDPDAAALLPRTVAAELVALPVAFGPGNTLVVAVADPGNTAALERVEAITGMATTPALTVRADLVRAIDHLADVAGDGAHSLARPAMAAAAVAAGAGSETAPAANGATVDARAPEEPAAPATAEPPPAAGAGDASGNGASETPGKVLDDPSLLAFEQELTIDLDEILLKLVDKGGSDLHLTSGLPPMIRVNGDLEPLDGYDRLGPTEIKNALYSILTQKQREVFENDLELDLSHSIPGKARFRVNVFQQRDALGSVMRVIPFEIKTIEELGVPAQITNFAYLPRGFVLVTGPTGSGKSTTLASLIDVINRERSSHIMTVEDPIEFLHKHKRSVVNQRELGTDTHSFASALKHVLRQDPDVILVGEMRDLETIQVALTAAETGHLVFGTLHTQDAPQTVDRVIDVFPPHQQEQIRVMLSGALQGVVCQQLLKTSDGTGRVAACEVMVATPAIRNLIREGKTHQMYSSIQAGKQYGMVTMDQSLADLVGRQRVTYDAALERCNNIADFNRLCGKA